MASGTLFAWNVDHPSVGLSSNLLVLNFRLKQKVEKVHSWYLTMGQYDAVLNCEFPSDELCAKFSLSAAALGNISTETLKAFPETEYRKMIASL